MSNLATESQKLNPSGMVSLFTLDTTSIGGIIYCFTMGSIAGAPVVYRGVSYQPIDIELKGMQASGTGSLARPELVLANTDGLIQAIVNTWGDLNGCKVTRIRTYTRFLDGMPEADPNAFYGVDKFVIDRKSTDTPEEISWELSAAIDQEGAYIGRDIIRDTCMWRYRRWDAVLGVFDNSKALCPYVGTIYFDANNAVVTNPALDVPSRGLTCCKKRFDPDNTGQPLPFGGFPGVSRSV